MKKIIYLLIILATLFTQTSVFAEELLQVETIERKPFVIQTNNELSGFSIELWREITHYLELDTEFNVHTKFAEMLNEVKKQETDFAIANISITTDRLEVMDFSDPFFESGLQMMAGNDGKLDIIKKSILQPNAKTILLWLFILFLIYVHIYYLFSHKKNKKYIPGISQSIWEMLTLGEFGKILPTKFFARLVVVMWMLTISCVTIIFTAHISSDLIINRTINSINSYHDLKGKKVGAISGSTAESFLRKEKIIYIPFSHIDTMFNSISDGNIDVVIHDYPVVKYYAEHDGAGKVALVGDRFQKEFYGIALPKNSMYTEQINTALLFLQENGTYNKLLSKWFGNL